MCIRDSSSSQPAITIGTCDSCSRFSGCKNSFSLSGGSNACEDSELFGYYISTPSVVIKT